MKLDKDLLWNEEGRIKLISAYAEESFSLEDDKLFEDMILDSRGSELTEALGDILNNTPRWKKDTSEGNKPSSFNQDSGGKSNFVFSGPFTEEGAFFHDKKNKDLYLKLESRTTPLILKLDQLEMLLKNSTAESDISSPLDDHFIFDYLSGFLPDRLSELVRQIEEKSPKIANYIHEQKSLLAAITQQENDQEELSTLIEGIDKKLDAEYFFKEPAQATLAKTRSLWSPKRLLAIAATLALLVLAGYFGLRNKASTYQDIYANFHQQETQAIEQLLDKVATSGLANPGQIQEALIAPLQAFRQSNFLQAQNLLLTYLQEQPNDIDAQFLLGLTQEELNQFEAASLTLTPIAQQESPWQTAAQYHLGMIYLNLPNTIEKAQNLLETVAQQESPYQGKAQEILDAL